MGRRCRHLNPKNMGAIQSVDARYIQGLSNGTTVSTWSDRCASLDFTQPTASSQPTYTTGSLNGQPSLRFDGTNDHMLCTDTALGSDYVIYVVGKVDSNGQAGIVISPRPGLGYFNGQVFRSYNYLSADRIYVYGGTFNNNTYEYYSSATAGMATWGSLGVVFGGAAESQVAFKENGKTLTTTRTSTFGTNTPAFNLGMVGAYQSNGAISIYAACNVAATTAFQSGAVAAPVLKRLEHSLGFSFKLPTS